MIDLSIDCGGIKSPNPFWLASAPPSNPAYQNCKAFEQGWGGTVWKTIGEPVMNVSNRYGGLDYSGEKLIGLNNVELISDRPIETNLLANTRCHLGIQGFRSSAKQLYHTACPCP